MGLTMKHREMVKFLESRGFEFVRSKGTSHRIYSDGEKSFPVAYHGSKELNIDIILSILREADIPKDDLLKYLGRK
ncbi:MAG: type II toxin-antitoxin system HicA family toxin [Defluviitaleaceae bacterium]|nr:type II toxin-antitoxin system HicA family toxin [Defluviitaleaceae bacterium]